jgi:hypothetical protein
MLDDVNFSLEQQEVVAVAQGLAQLAVQPVSMIAIFLHRAVRAIP